MLTVLTNPAVFLLARWAFTGDKPSHISFSLAIKTPGPTILRLIVARVVELTGGGGPLD